MRKIFVLLTALSLSVSLFSMPRWESVFLEPAGCESAKGEAPYVSCSFYPSFSYYGFSLKIDEFDKENARLVLSVNKRGKEFPDSFKGYAGNYEKPLPSELAKKIRDVYTREIDSARPGERLGLDGTSYQFVYNNAKNPPKCAQIWSPQLYNPARLVKLQSFLMEYAFFGKDVDYKELATHFPLEKPADEAASLEKIGELVDILLENKNTPIDLPKNSFSSFDRRRSFASPYFYQRPLSEYEFKAGTKIEGQSEFGKVSMSFVQRSNGYGNFLKGVVGNQKFELDTYTVSSMENGIKMDFTENGKPFKLPDGNMTKLHYYAALLNFDSLDDFKLWAEANPDYPYTADGVHFRIEYFNTPDIQSEKALRIIVYRFLVDWELAKVYPPSPRTPDFKITMPDQPTPDLAPEIVPTYEKAIDGDIAAQCALGEYFSSKKDINMYLWYTKAAAAGNWRSQVFLSGDSIRCNSRRNAVLWYYVLADNIKSDKIVGDELVEAKAAAKTLQDKLDAKWSYFHKYF